MNRHATVLLRQAMAAFAVSEPGAHAPALQRLDAFLAAPGALTFLHASRALVDLRRAGNVGRTQRRVAARLFERGRAEVEAVPGIDRMLLAALERLDVDHGAGARLHALAHMARTYQELAGRSEAVTAELRRQFKASRERPAPPPPRPAPPRAPARNKRTRKPDAAAASKPPPPGNISVPPPLPPPAAPPARAARKRGGTRPPAQN